MGRLVRCNWNDNVYFEGSPLAAPRTVAQLLLREEDLSKRESEIDYRLQTKKMDMEDEFVSKHACL